MRKITFNRKNITVPFVVCGDSGHHVNPLVQPRKVVVDLASHAVV